MLHNVSNNDRRILKFIENKKKFPKGLKKNKFSKLLCTFFYHLQLKSD